MEQNSVLVNNSENKIAIKFELASSDTSKIPNVVLQRLIQEVQYESQNNILAYNRTHNRHNRGR
jgi:hypothetical protein